MLLLLTLTALAAEPSVVWPVVDAPPELVRVEDPDHPDAVTRSASGALLLAPPADGTPWRAETLAVPDGQPGDVNTASLNADAWHEAGFRGQGVKVAVFDLQWFGAEADPADLGPVTTADCWAHPSCEIAMDTLVPRFGYENGSHGYACAEVVRSIAPDAELALVRVNGFTTFESAADWAIRNEVDVISMSMSFFNESFYDGTGPFEPVLRRLATAGVLVVVSSGNYANQHWSGPWRDVDRDGRFDFDGGNGLDVTFGGGGGRKTIYLNWDEHFACGRSDLDAFVYDPAGFVVGRAMVRQDPTGDRCDPVERVPVEVNVAGTYRLEVIGRRVMEAFLGVDVLSLGGQIPGGNPGGSITDPGSSPWVFTVGAVRAEGYLANDAELFSSQGPVASGVPKPDVAGPDGLSTDIYGARGFFGTSASTPAVAAAAALVLSRYPDLTPQEAGERLKVWAWREDERVDDPRFGAGKVRLPPPDAPRGGCLGGGAAALVFVPLLGARRRRGEA